jgi:hypothetical protein
MIEEMRVAESFAARAGRARLRPMKIAVRPRIRRAAALDAAAQLASHRGRDRYQARLGKRLQGRQLDRVTPADAFGSPGAT